jgi:transcription elongation factor Elf1
MAQTEGAHGWPLVPSKAFPGEQTLTCPVCGSTNVTLSVIYGPSGRLGDPGSLNTITCESCGKRDYESVNTGRRV